MQLNLRMTMVSVSVATASLGAGIFGMNLMSGLEEFPFMMFGVGGALACTWVN